VSFALHVLARERADGPPAAPASVRARGDLVDSHGRTIRDLRISITDRCNFRCVYCMSPDVQFRPADELLTRDEIVRLAGITASMGVTKIRLTGGEPTLRTDLVEIIEGIRRAAPVKIAMITNGSQIDAPRLARWRGAGLDRLTFSIDSVDPARFAAVTRSRCAPESVIDAIELAIAANLTPVKVNAVLLRGVNEDDAVELAALAHRLPIEMRFIEYMPLDSDHAWDPRVVVTAAETRAMIERRFPLCATGTDEPSSTARTYRFCHGGAGSIGFIAPVSTPFCGQCSRLRITSDGHVRPCLFSRTEWNLRPLLRTGATDDELRAFLVDATWTKQAGHGISSASFMQPERTMSAIGG